MNRINVSSSDLLSIGYDPDQQTLEIEFNGGGVYRYYDVPEAEYSGLMNASSHGKYFHQHIKNRYSYRKIS